MNRFMRMRHYNSNERKFDVLFPQTDTGNILRGNGGGVLEYNLQRYDRHLAGKQIHMNHAVSTGTFRELSVTLPDTVLEDGLPLLLTLHTDLECEPTLSFNGSEPAHIVSGNGENISGGQAEGTVIFLVWSEMISSWVLMSDIDTSDITKVLIPMESEYVRVVEAPEGESIFVIPEFDKSTDKLVVNYGQTILRQGVDYTFHQRSANTIELIDITVPVGDMLFFTITKYTLTAKRGTLKYDLQTTDVSVGITENGTTTVPLPEQALDANSIAVNYGQTILRNTLDYDYSADGKSIVLREIQIPAGDVITFHITKLVESNGEILPNNWGAAGTYRYAMDVIRTEYTAVEDNVSVIPVPNFDHRKDDIWPIYDNHLLIYDLDYTIDELGQVVLLQMELMHDQTIYFTILRGAMFDVPNFNTIRASGDSGQHILINISYSILCNEYVLLVKLAHDLETNPTIKTIDGPAEPVCDCFGYPILGGYRTGSYLWLVYDADNHIWYSLGHGQVDITSLMPSYKTRTGTSHFVGQDPDMTPGTDYREAVIEHGLGVVPEKIDVQPTEPPGMNEDGTPAQIGDVWSYADETYLYVGNSGTASSAFKWSVSTEDDTADLRTYIDQQISELQKRPGNFITQQYVYTAEEDGVAYVPINAEGFTGTIDKLIVNYGQTLLREGIDYVVDATGIQLTHFTLSAGDILQFIIIEQEMLIDTNP